MSLVNAKYKCRLIIEFDKGDEMENFLEFIGRSIDSGVLIASFEWTAEEVTTFTKEDDDE